MALGRVWETVDEEPFFPCRDTARLPPPQALACHMRMRSSRLCGWTALTLNALDPVLSFPAPMGQSGAPPCRPPLQPRASRPSLTSMLSYLAANNAPGTAGPGALVRSAGQGGATPVPPLALVAWGCRSVTATANVGTPNAAC